jgi:hypothetical protein
METKIRAVMTNGEVWEIDARPIAENRAKYYSVRDSERPGLGSEPNMLPEDIYREEYEYTLSSDYEIMDWAQNNMNWDELLPHAKKVQDAPAATFQSLWNDSPSLRVVKTP